MSIDNSDDLMDWNAKLYRDQHPGLTGEYGADWFWNELEIKSAPKFKDCCWHHIPKCWADEVKAMVVELREKFPSIEFTQIKEKFCDLTVYWSIEDYDSDVSNKVRQVIKKYKNKLRDEGLHP